MVDSIGPSAGGPLGSGGSCGDRPTVRGMRLGGTRRRGRGHRGRTAALALVSAGAGVLAAFRADMRAARARLVAGSHLVQTARGPLEVAESGTGPPVLVVHGSGGGFDQGLLAAGSLPDGYRIIAPSRFGHLRSPMPADASHAARADTLAALLDALALSRVIVLAVSAASLPRCTCRPPRRSPRRLHRPTSSSTTCSPRTSPSG